MMIRTKPFTTALVITLLLLADSLSAASTPELKIPPETRFINGTGQLPLILHEFKAPGFTCQGYMEICEAASPRIYLLGWNNSPIPLTMRQSFKTSPAGELKRITFSERNQKLKLTNPKEETVVDPYQFYITDPITIDVKRGDKLYLRTHVKLEKNLKIGCGVFAPFSDPRPDKRWSYGVYTGEDDRTMDPDLETQWKPNFDGLFVPFLAVGENVNPKSKFIVAVGDSLTFQNGPDKQGGWFQQAFIDIPHCNTALAGDMLTKMISPKGDPLGPANVARLQVLQYATDVINFYGHNDLGTTVSVPAMINVDKKLAARPELANARLWRFTLTPYVHYKDGAKPETATEEDQVPDSHSPAIIRFNKALRENYKDWGYDGVIEIGGELATDMDSPYWKTGMSGDGTHFRKPALKIIAPIARTILEK